MWVSTNQRAWHGINGASGLGHWTRFIDGPLPQAQLEHLIPWALPQRVASIHTYTISSPLAVAAPCDLLWQVLAPGSQDNACRTGLWPGMTLAGRSRMATWHRWYSPRGGHRGDSCWCGRWLVDTTTTTTVWHDAITKQVLCLGQRCDRCWRWDGWRWRCRRMV